jgi:hypothetical protein
MDVQFEMEWQAVVKRVEAQFGEDVDLQAILYLIGVQELGSGFKTFKKDEKVDLMHVALCTLLEPYGYYIYDGVDSDGWPHFTRSQTLPPLEPREQELLVKRAIVQYFAAMGEIESK